MMDTVKFLPRPSRAEIDAGYNHPTEQARQNADRLVAMARQIATGGEPIYGYPGGSIMGTPLATVHKAWHYPDEAWLALNGTVLPGDLIVLVSLNTAGTRRTKYAEIGAYPAWSVAAGPQAPVFA